MIEGKLMYSQNFYDYCGYFLYFDNFYLELEYGNNRYSFFNTVTGINIF